MGSILGTSKTGKPVSFTAWALFDEFPLSSPRTMTDLEELPEPVGAECEDLRLLLKGLSATACTVMSNCRNQDTTLLNQSSNFTSTYPNLCRSLGVATGAKDLKRDQKEATLESQGLSANKFANMEKSNLRGPRILNGCFLDLFLQLSGTA
ncbi:unnamed protein product [Fusarium graminearum]|nr:unnamed protein product [Fusarium graminearum]